MSEINCPYCEIKAQSNIKIRFDAIESKNGKCPDCGAWLDEGQKTVDINSYIETFNGAIRLMQRMTEEFNYWLDYFGVDVSEHLAQSQENAIISINTSDIIDELFLHGYGDTTKRNFLNALGVYENKVNFKIKADIVE